MSSDRLIVEVHGIPAGVLSRDADGYTFKYLTGYHGPSVSLTMPVLDQSYGFTDLPPFFDGLLPEGIGLEGLLRSRKLNRMSDAIVQWTPMIRSSFLPLVDQDRYLSLVRERAIRVGLV